MCDSSTRAVTTRGVRVAHIHASTPMVRGSRHKSPYSRGLTLGTKAPTFGQRWPGSAGGPRASATAAGTWPPPALMRTRRGDTAWCCCCCCCCRDWDAGTNREVEPRSITQPLHNTTVRRMQEQGEQGCTMVHAMCVAWCVGGRGRFVGACNTTHQKVTCVTTTAAPPSYKELCC